MAINPQSAFVRIYVDLATPVAIEFDAYSKAVGKRKNVLIREAIEQLMANNKQQTRGKKK